MSEALANQYIEDWQVPDYNVWEYFEKRHRYCVCVFVINEGEKIQKQLRAMAAFATQLDIIIADGGSTDRSLEPEFLKSNGIRTLLVKTGPGKLSAQMRMAFAYALTQGYAGIVTIDGNNKDDPAALPQFITALDEGYDHIQGSRFIPGGKAVNTPWQRLIGVKLMHAPLISLSSGFHYTDTTNGFRAYSRRLLLDPRVAPFRDVFVAYELHYYLAIRAARLGFRLLEVPVTRRYPASGGVPTKISPLKGNLSVLITLFKACLRQFDPIDDARHRI
jgi:glycosyltransferase involved in cell wall biosynthesis